MPDPDPVAAYLAEAERTRSKATGIPMQGEQLTALITHAPRLVAALEAVLSFHQNADDRCTWCRTEAGLRAKWPCGEYRAITAALLGERTPGD